jgi:hypothetical protein
MSDSLDAAVGRMYINEEIAIENAKLKKYIEKHVFSLKIWYYGTSYFAKYDTTNGFNSINIGEFDTENEALRAVAYDIYKDTCRFCIHYSEHSWLCQKSKENTFEDGHYDCIEKKEEGSNEESSFS